jgi:hypothetical protein
MLPQHTSLTYCAGHQRDIRREASITTDFLHVSPIILIGSLQSFVHIVFPGHLIPHFNSFIVKHLVCLLDLVL